MIKKYVKKPVVVETVLWDGTYDRAEFISDWMAYNDSDRILSFNSVTKDLEIQTLEGTMTATKGDIIIKGVDGEFYPCKPDIFKKTYEEVK